MRARFVAEVGDELHPGRRAAVRNYHLADEVANILRAEKDRELDDLDLLARSGARHFLRRNLARVRVAEAENSLVIFFHSHPARGNGIQTNFLVP